LRSRRPAASALAGIALVLAASAACAPFRFVPPADAGVPVADAAGLWQKVAAPCLGVKSMTAELALSGRAGGTRIRGRVQSGFAGNAMMRLEGVAPFGQPVFILVSTPSAARLLLPRDERLVSAPDAQDILEALVGVRLQAHMLMAALAGCAMRDMPTSATAHGDITRLVFADGEAFIRTRGPQMRIVAARARSFLIEYPDEVASGPWPRRVRISRQMPGDQGVDLTIDLSQIETNITLPPEAFTIDVPPGTMPMSLQQLRAAGPLGDR
jgi:hypothetical protein